jgi:hypothetical protein
MDGRGYQKKCHPDRSEAQWRDLLFIIPVNESEWKRHPTLCHPDRSVAEWRDLQFSRPFMEMFLFSLFPLTPLEIASNEPMKQVLPTFSANGKPAGPISTGVKPALH